MRTQTTSMSPLLFCLTLAACGGGGSSSGTQPATDAGTISPAAANAAETSAATYVAAAPSAPTASIAFATPAAPAAADTTGALTAPSAASTTATTASTPSATPANQPAVSTDASTSSPGLTASPVVVDTSTSAASTTDIVVASATPPQTSASSGSVATNPAPAGQDASQYTLTFSDEFNSGSTFDTSKWSTDIYYKTNNPTANYNVAGGTLNIWPALDSHGAFFDRTIVSAGHFSQQYGFFEVEAKLPVGAGLHPVISLTANNGPEIAIMHAYSGAPNGAWSSNAMHPVDYVFTAMSGPDNYVGEFRARNFRSIPDLSAAFHKYGIRWDANTVTYYFDGAQVGQPIAHNSIRTPMYFYIGLWMVNEETSASVGSGTLSQSNPYTPTGSGNALKVNYARAWRFKN